MTPELRPQDLENTMSQCLAQNKRPLGMLVGAGCPVAIRMTDEDGNDEPLIPDIRGLTARINDILGRNRTEFSDLVSRLTADLEHDPNIEEILSHIRGLASVVGKGKVHKLNATGIKDLETAVTAEITRAVSVELPLEQTPYDSLALWAHATERDKPIKIFTTNYDMLLESAFERRNAPFFDGFVGAREPFIDAIALETDDLPTRWTRIIKLHGSSNWTVRGNQVIRLVPSNSQDERLIHPSHLKYSESRRMPYLAMFDQLRAFLGQESATLFIVGFSFADAHINELLSYGLRKNPSAKVFGLQYGDFSDYPEAIGLARDHLGLTVAARDRVIDCGRELVWQSENDDHSGFKLGDFALFGDYLRSLVGTSEEEAEDGIVATDDVSSSPEGERRVEAS